MKKTIYIITLLTLISCQKIQLDSLAFPSESLESYSFENENFPNEYVIDTKDRHQITFASINQITGEEYLLYGVYIGDTATINTDTVILYCHGQSKHMDTYYNRASLLANLSSKHQYGVLMMDYRGYGRSEGTPSEMGLSEDVDAAINWLINKGAKGQNTFFYGFSLGCIPVIERTANKTDFQPSKIMIESPLGSVAYLAQSSLIINVDPKFVSSLNFENAEIIKEINQPLLWIHGEEDDYVAIENGEIIYSNYNGSYGEAHRIVEANHSDIPQIMGYDIYIKTLEEFIKK